MYGITVAAQTKNLLLGLGLGFIIGIIYDIFRIIRLSISRGRTAVFIQDILFFLLFSGITFSFCLGVNNGEVRFYIIFAEVLGFLIYYFSFGSFVIKLSDTVISALRRFFSFVFKLFKTPVLFIFRIFSLIFGKISKFTRKSSKKVGKKLKFLLQRNYSLLYNTVGGVFAKRKKKSERNTLHE